MSQVQKKSYLEQCCKEYFLVGERSCQIVPVAGCGCELWHLVIQQGTSQHSLACSLEASEDLKEFSCDESEEH